MEAFGFKFVKAGAEEGTGAAMHEAKKVAGGNTFGHNVAAGAIGSTIAGVGSYQMNRHINNKVGAPAPPLSARTGTTPSSGEASLPYSTRKGGKYNAN